MEIEIEYYNRRAQEERDAGLAASDARARQAHLELARRYDELSKPSGSGHMVGHLADVPELHTANQHSEPIERAG